MWSSVAVWMQAAAIIIYARVVQRIAPQVPPNFVSQFFNGRDNVDFTSGSSAWRLLFV